MKSKLAYLSSEAGSALLGEIMADKRDDLGLASAPLMRSLAAGERTALLEQRALRNKALRKHSRALEMLFTPLGMQQMTSEPIARYKSGKLPEDLRSVADLCCGMGGESFHLPDSVSSMGVDLDPEALIAYRHNTGLFRSSIAVEADITRLEADVDGILLDPARRSLASLGGKRDFDTDPEPGWDAILDLIKKFRNAAIKLGPGVKLPDSLAEEEQEYIGFYDECLELTVRTGSFGRPGWVRAIELPENVFVEAQACDLPDSFGRVEEPGTYFYEPVKCVIRSHLFGIIAQREGLWQLDGRLAYLSGDKKVESPLLKRYRVIKQLPVDDAVLRRELSVAEVGILEIKKRGLDVGPEEWRKKLKPKGPNSATLVFTRLQGKASVLWVEPDKAV